MHAKQEYRSNVRWIPSGLEQIIVMSSAYDSVLTHISGWYPGISKVLILMSFSIDLSSGSMHIMNRAQDRASPCLTDLRILKVLVVNPLTITEALRSLYMVLTQFMYVVGKLYALRQSYIYSWSTESKAFFASRVKIYACFLLVSQISISSSRYLVLSPICLPGMYPHCVFINSFSRTWFVLVAIVLVHIFMSQLVRDMGLRFSIAVLSFPFFSRSVMTEYLCEFGSLPISVLFCHTLSISGPSKSQWSLYILYGIPSGPGALSSHDSRAVLSSASVMPDSSLILSSSLILGRSLRKSCVSVWVGSLSYSLA